MRCSRLCSHYYSPLHYSKENKSKIFIAKEKRDMGEPWIKQNKIMMNACGEPIFYTLFYYLLKMHTSATSMYYIARNSKFYVPAVCFTPSAQEWRVHVLTFAKGMNLSVIQVLQQKEDGSGVGVIVVDILRLSNLCLSFSFVKRVINWSFHALARFAIFISDVFG